MLKKFKSVAVIDFETTGLSPENDYPTEVAILKVNLENGNEEEFESLIKLPKGVEVPSFITELTGLTTEKVNEKGQSIQFIKELLEEMIINDTLVVAHNANFDLGFLYHHFGIKPVNFICTRTIEFLTNPEVSSSLEPTYKRYFEDVEQEHRALKDVYMTINLFDKHKEVHGSGIEFFLNKVMITPERKLVYTPDNAKVLDFSVVFEKR